MTQSPDSSLARFFYLPEYLGHLLDILVSASRKVEDHEGILLQLRRKAHKLRHSAITAALDVTNGDVRRVQRLSRHARLETLQRYDDNRSDLQGEVTTLLAELLHGEEE